MSVISETAPQGLDTVALPNIRPHRWVARLWKMRGLQCNHAMHELLGVDFVHLLGQRMDHMIEQE